MFSKLQLDDMKKHVNVILENESISQETKEALFYFFSNILSESKCYHGFNWIRWYKKGGASEWFALVEARQAQENDFEHRQQFMGPEYDRFFY
jgi:hypothetical protein